MKRITVEEVKAAFEYANLPPVRGNFRKWSDDDEDVVCGVCAQTALMMAETKCPVITLNPFDVIAWIAERCGHEYGSAFRAGFDNNEDSRLVGTPGYVDGASAATAVFGGAA